METGGINTILISRTDSIGDVLLTLPVCAWLKWHYPAAEIIFLGKGYTKSVVEHYSLVDRFIDWNDFQNIPFDEAVQRFKDLNADVIIHVFPNKEIATLAKKAGIRMRIGTSHRTFHLLNCTHRVNFTRKRSDLHESQLNHELLRPLGLNEIPSLDDIQKTTTYLKVPEVDLPANFGRLTQYTILHPKSQGSALEWPVEKYILLTETLADEHKTVVFTGTEAEGIQFRDRLPNRKEIVDSTGQLTLEQLMVLISGADNLVACSTGPLHLAGYYGVNTIGLFSSRRPIHPGRWKALGKNVSILVNENCPTCKKGKFCDCMTEIPVEQVLEKLK